MSSVHGSPSRHTQQARPAGGSGASSSSSGTARRSALSQQTARRPQPPFIDEADEEEPQAEEELAPATSSSKKKKRAAQAAARLSEQLQAQAAEREAADGGSAARMEAPDSREARGGAQLDQSALFQILQSMQRQMDAINAKLQASEAREAAAAAAEARSMAQEEVQLGAVGRAASSSSSSSSAPPMAREGSDDDGDEVSQARGHQASEDQQLQEHNGGEARSHSSSTHSGTYRIARKQMAATTPSAKLVLLKASEARVLEVWIDEMEDLFEQYGITEDEPAKLREMKIWSDNDTRAWAKQMQESATARGEPITTWARWIEMLREQLQPKHEAQRRIEAFLKLQQAVGEGMHKYLVRAMAAVAHLPARKFTPFSIMQTVLNGIARRSEYAEVLKKVERKIHAGTIGDFAELRTFLSAQTAADLGAKAGGAPSAPTTQPKQQPRGGAQSLKKQQKFLAAAAALFMPGGDGEEEEEEDDSDAKRVAAVTAAKDARTARSKADKTCARCKKPGHWAAQCTEKEDRTCFVCGVAGHIAPQCPQKKTKNA